MNSSILNYHKKEDAITPSLSTFQPCQCDVKIEEDFLEILRNQEKAEEEYYGFVWSHQIEKCKNYTGKTIEDFVTGDLEIGPIEVQIRKITQMKGPRATYYTVEVEDANGDIGRVTVWSDDQSRFEEDLVKGKFVRLSVKAPSPGFNNYTLSSLPNRYRKPPRSLDNRVIVIE